MREINELIFSQNFNEQVDASAPCEQGYLLHSHKLSERLELFDRAGWRRALRVTMRCALNIVFSAIWYFMSLWWFFKWHFLWLSLQVMSTFSSSNANYRDKIWYIMHPTFMWWNIVMVDWNWNETSLSKWQQLQHCESIMPKSFYKEWQMTSGIHLVLVTLHRWFVISIGQVE